MLKKIFVTFFILIIIGISLYAGIYNHNSKEKEIPFNDILRRYRIHVPKNYNESQSYPLVVALHGLGDDGRIMELLTGLSYKADRENFIVVYPYGVKPARFSPRSWNAEICCDYAFQNNIDDVGYINYLIEQLENEYKIDDKRIFVVGYSNGGMLAHLFSLKHGEKVAALGVVSGAVGSQYEDEEEVTFMQNSQIPIPAIIMHGRKDTAIPFDGGGSASGDVYFFTSAYDAVNLWLDNNQCAKHPTEILKSQFSTTEIYSNCEGAEVLFYALNSSHNWPVGIFGKNIKATDVIWEFFSHHRKN